MLLDIFYNIVISPIEVIFDAIFCYLQRFPGLAIIAISLVMNFLALPLYKRADAIQEEERLKTESMSRWMNHIKKTFQGDERYMMLSAYYKEEGYKPVYALRSLFPLLLQIPFFIAAYHYLSNQPLLRGASFLFLRDLGQPDQLLTIGGVTINVMPIIMTLINLVSAFIYLRGFPLKDKIQTYGIAVIFLVLLYNSPSGLVFYWTLNQIFSVAKNVFMKFVKEPKLRSRIFSIGGVAVVAVFLALGQLFTRKRMLAAAIILIFCCLPWLPSACKEKFKDHIKPAKPIETKYFILGAVFLALFLGMLIPLAVIESDPEEFVTRVATPASLVVNNISIYSGFFILWLGIYYYLSNVRMRNIFTIAVWILSGVFFVNYFLFPGNYGIMSSNFVFDTMPVFARSEIIINGLVMIAVIAACFFVFRKWKKAVSYVYIILIIAFIGLSGYYAINIAHATRIVDTPDSRAADSLTLSKNGKNVVVLVVDKAMGGYVPFIFDEKPELIDQYSGFTFYPNTLSYGIVTKWGAPGLYGGHSYSPLELNKRDDELLVDKHDEALSVMPAIFSANGYNTTVWESVLAGYGDPEKAAALYDFDTSIKRLSLKGDYEEPFYEKYGQSLAANKYGNLIQYCAFRVLPVGWKGNIYNLGSYLRTARVVYYDEDFLNSYAALCELPKITSIEESGNNFLMLYNPLPHNPAPLDHQTYEPIEDASITRSIEIDNRIRTIDGRTLKTETIKQSTNYDSNMATYILIGRWLDYLRQQGVYDNTRIIIASDHGAVLNGHLENSIIDKRFDTEALKYIENPEIEKRFDIEGLNCLLMVKDFDSEAEFSASEDFHVNADVPALAAENVLNKTINPFTGNDLVLDSIKDEVTVTYVDDWEMNQSEKIFNTSLGTMWSVKKGDIYDQDNWKLVK